MKKLYEIIYEKNIKNYFAITVLQNR